jgi:hypothetical protein
MDLKVLLTQQADSRDRQLAVFSVLVLGIIESLANGMVSATDAIRVFFNAENCSFVRKQLRDKVADEVMGRGVQVPDVLDILPPDEAHREFQRELATMRSLCLKLLEDRRLVA